jgi:hypothetical protein
VKWTASTDYAASQYVSYNNNIYKNNGGANTSGATAPTHTTGSASDGTISWTYVDGTAEQPFDYFRHDEDFCLIDEDVIALGVMARWMYTKGMQNNLYMVDYMSAIKRRTVANKGAPTLSLIGSNNPLLLGPWHIPDSGYGV